MTDWNRTGRHRTPAETCGCTGGGNWVFLAIAAGLVGLYVVVSVLS